MNNYKSVEDYIDSSPDSIKPKLNTIRDIIKDAAPHATEKISYGMPYYGYKGRLVYFAYYKNHIGFYAMSPAMEKYKDEVKSFRTGKATLQFNLDQKLPEVLIRKLVREMVRVNEAK